MASLVSITTGGPKDEDTIPVFSIDGEMYTMPKTVSAGFLIETMHKLRDHSMEAVLSWMLEYAVGSAGYQALRKHGDDISVDQLKGIMDVVSEHVLGQMEKVKEGN